MLQGYRQNGFYCIGVVVVVMNRWNVVHCYSAWNTEKLVTCIDIMKLKDFSGVFYLPVNFKFLFTGEESWEKVSTRGVG